MTQGGASRPIKVAVIGGGCAAITAAFELTQPEHAGRFTVTVYQLGWRLGGKGASGRGPAGRIEEHGLHIWLGFYENAFALVRAAYAEAGRDPETCPIATWRDAFFPDSHVGVADRFGGGQWGAWLALFPPAPGLPGDPIGPNSPFTLANYVARAVALLRALLFSARSRDKNGARPEAAGGVDLLVERASRLLGAGALTAAGGVSEALAVLTGALRALPVFPEALLVRLVDSLASAVRGELGRLVDLDPNLRRKWDVIDLVLAFLVGVARFRLMSDPRGLSAIDHFDCREFLRLNGASERALQSGFVRALYDLALAYEDGDPEKPGIAAGQGLRGALRMFFTYRGGFFWKMRAGMGDCVFAPLYEVLRRRGVRFEFFHRLDNLKLAERLAPGERPYIAGLEFDVQAEMAGGGQYQPLVDIKGLPSWPAQPDFAQLAGGARLQAQDSRFESHWDQRAVARKTLRVTQDFDFVVLGVGVGAIPFVAREIVARDPRWQAMVAHVKTVATQAFQIWLDRDAAALGWSDPSVTLAGFAKPFDTWADMTHLTTLEAWASAPKSIAYFCNVLADGEAAPEYEATMRAAVRDNAIAFLKRDLHELWPQAAGPGAFRFDWLIDPQAREGEARFASQFWTANVNPSDRYVLMLPGSLVHRISPLDNTYDNLTLAGDWTDCGYNAGCVEAAVMSGRLAAHALSGLPRLEAIVGYDHP
ncbi:MAG TPA: FAD-dependent oxidoreductase [Roseiarcus sp.]|nr:FAD-dependent oxidoreductase [Roseiarcus sp.]